MFTALFITVFTLILIVICIVVYRYSQIPFDQIEILISLKRAKARIEYCQKCGSQVFKGSDKCISCNNAINVSVSTKK